MCVAVRFFVAVCVAVCGALGVLQWVWCCSEIPLFAISVGSVSCRSFAVRFCPVHVAVGVLQGVLRCVLQW